MLRPQRSQASAGCGEEPEHGEHTLRVQAGHVVGLNADDVFVELGPRMQGVISARRFPQRPSVGEEYEFTLRGQEEGLWVLELRTARALASWESMEVGQQVEARLVRPKHGGLEAKVGELHGFVPRSETGLPRERSPEILVGKVLVCEVVEVDHERQRIVLSRKRVLARERLGGQRRAVGALVPGRVVSGRVTRVESYGVFLSFGAGITGMIHVSDLSYRRIAHPSELVQKGERLDAKVLSIGRGGKRIALGLKQLEVSPWGAFEREHGPRDVLTGTVTRLAPYGAFVELRAGVVGLVHRSEMGVGTDAAFPPSIHVGAEVPVRVLTLDLERERLGLSLLRPDGATLDPLEAALAEELEEALEPEEVTPANGVLGVKLRAVLNRRRTQGEDATPRA